TATSALSSLLAPVVNRAAPMGRGWLFSRLPPSPTRLTTLASPAKRTSFSYQTPAVGVVVKGANELTTVALADVERPTPKTSRLEIATDRYFIPYTPYSIIY